MALTQRIGLDISGSDRSLHFCDGSLSINLRANEAGSGSVKLRARIASADLGYEVPAYRPAEGELVTFTWDGETIWRGEITQIKSVAIAPRWVAGAQQLSPIFHYLTLAGLEARLAKRIVGASSTGLPGLTLISRGEFGDQDPVYSGGVVSQLLSDYGATGITAGTIEDGYEISSIAYGINGGTSTWKAISNQARADGHVAFVDETGALHYRRRGYQTASFVVAADALNYNRVELTTDRKEYRTREHTRINYKAFDPSVESFAGSDEGERSVTVSEPIARIETVRRVNGPNKVEQSFGVEDVDTSTPEWTYQPGTQTLTMNPDSPGLVLLESVEVTYRAVGSDVVTVDLPQPGLTEIPIEVYKEDLRITSVDEAQQAGLQAIESSMVSVSTLALETNTHVEPNCIEIRPGLAVPVDVPDVGAQGTYVVNSVAISDESGLILRYKIDAVSGAPAEDADLGPDQTSTQPYAAPYTADPTTGAQATTSFAATDSTSAPPIKDSGAARMLSYMRTGVGSYGAPNELDTGHPAEGDTEYTVFGIGIGQAAEVGEDVTPRRSIYSNGNPYEVWGNCKTGSLTFDIQYSADRGETWTSIFSETPTLTADDPGVFTTFADEMFFERGGLLRADVIATDGATDAHLLLRWKYLTGPAGDTGSDDGDTEGVPTTL